MSQINSFLIQVLNEDIGSGDLFYNLIDDKKAKAKILCKESGILSGIEYALVLCEMKEIEIQLNYQDGDIISKGDIILTLEGNFKDLLQIERTLLNTLQHSSGIATQTNRFVKKLSNSDIKLLDTRKTRPLLRTLEKYSVRNGGGYNHRMGLYDTLMLKDTHLAGIKDIKSFLETARKNIPWTSKIEVECENVAQCKEMLSLDVDIIMCDNMSTSDIKEVLEYRNKNSIKTLIECSGNMDEKRLDQLKDIKIDAISVGSITHQATWLDFSMKML
ncbi:MAG: Quinolinate phosphoribosyltransferase [decarboxylating] (EC [uncultured Campylobacterales bacterium]|uniref:Probable nicotinate-nucleotide pyrophosphorylase [carboxylating] n=1 Tax=uncultured Campylobacterales bacterium TaxID=352960 RepID=A0A6S6T112_9BACT|nr:MAG: Quinolinate phosphoribosyltransferase [decarboxylating] (EC [uncultured Campylobacterales bacterium]